MLKSNKTRNPNQPRIGAELTPSQLVLAICVFLCAALICFSLGVIVGKYDERNNNREKGRTASSLITQLSGQTPSADASGVKGAKALDNLAKAAAEQKTSAPGEGVQTSPRPIVVPPSPGKPGYPESGVTTPGSVQAGPRVSEHPAPPKPGDTPVPPAPPANAASPPAESTPTAPAAAPDPKKEPAPKAAPATPAQAVPAAGEPAIAAGEKPAETPKAEVKIEPPALEPVVAETAKADKTAVSAQPASADPKKGLYTIQLAALTSATRKEQGLAMKKKLEADGLQPELLISRDGARVSVVVGSYPDRQAAQAACNELRKNKGFSDCFVRTR